MNFITPTAGFLVSQLMIYLIQIKLIILPSILFFNIPPFLTMFEITVKDSPLFLTFFNFWKEVYLFHNFFKNFQIFFQKSTIFGQFFKKW